ncbi:MAG TPA: hypothetical protein VD963_00460, partial [Phycisphaerales bacterium]|nr:hypothetical protein [Phycisphaerales bacterium]
MQAVPVIPAPGARPNAEVADRLKEIEARHSALGESLEAVRALFDPLAGQAPTRLSVLYDYIGVFLVSFLVALLATPVMRRLAVSNGIIDRPLETRKAHRFPVAYLGGVAVYLGIMAGILFAYAGDLHGLVSFHPSSKNPQGGVQAGVPVSILLGMTVIMLTGLIDDVHKISPRIKVAGQLVAAAALAYQDVGVKVATQVVVPLARALGVPLMSGAGGTPTVGFLVPIPGVGDLPVDLVYWIGTGLIAVFVLGACNASNLIDGLDG